MDRLLDLVGLKSYPTSPTVRRGMSVGINVHVDASRFAEIRAAGFDTVLLDWVSAYPPDFYEDLFARARAAGLAVFVTGFPQDVDLVESAQELFGRHGHAISYAAVRNEPDLARFYSGSIGQLAEDIRAVWAVKQTRARHVQLVAPCFSALHSSARPNWQEKEPLVAALAKMGVVSLVDVIGLHAYQRTPDAVERYVREQIRIFRAAGWHQPVFVSEFGWRSAEVGEKKQGLYLVNTLAQLSRLPDVAGMAIYELQDGAGGSYGVLGKKTWGRIETALETK